MALREVADSQEKQQSGQDLSSEYAQVANASGNSEPFFILGCGRSGTSLLSRMLNQHPRIAVPYESHLFNTFYDWLHLYGDLQEEKNLERLVADILSTDVMRDWDPCLSQKEVRGQIQQKDFGGVVEALLSTYALKTGKARWGEKTPQHVYCWDAISQLFPQSRVIHIVRDGRDVALSLLRARFGPKSIYGCATYWNRYLNEIEKLKETISPDSIHQVKYETLLEHPESELRAICSFLGEHFAPEMLEFHKNKSIYKTDIENQQNLMNPLLKDNKQKWRREMSHQQLTIFESVSGKYLVNYGYDLSFPNLVKLSGSSLFYHRNVEAPLLKIKAMLKNRKGHRDALIRLSIYLRLRLIDPFYRR